MLDKCLTVWYNNYAERGRETPSASGGKSPLSAKVGNGEEPKSQGGYVRPLIQKEP